MMMRLATNNLIFFSILISPWINVLIRHGFLKVVITSFALTLIMLALKNPLGKKTNIDTYGLAYIVLALFSVLFSFLYHFYSIGLTPQEGGYLTFIHFYGALIILLVYWLLILYFSVELESKLYWFARYFFIVSIANILWGFFVDIADLPRSLEIMQHPEYTDGAGRPFGLTGNAAVNSTMLVVCYLIMVREKLKKDMNIGWKWFILLCAGIVVQKSGSGLAALVIAAMYHAMFFPLMVRIKVFIMAVVFFFIGFLYELEAFRRVSIDYMLHIYMWLEINVISFLSLEMSIFDWLFGKAEPLGTGVMTTDFGALYMVNQMGLLFFIFVTLLFLRVAFRLKLLVDKFIMFIIFLTGFHYQSVFFLSSSAIFSMYMVVVLSEVKFNRILTPFK